MVLFYAVDRFEEPDRVVLEGDDARAFGIPRAWLPSGLREGDVISVRVDVASSDLAQLEFRLDAEERERRLADASRRRQQLPKGPKGDISL